MMLRKPDFDIPVYHTLAFTWTGGNVGIAEQSDFKAGGGLIGGRVWNDSADVGFFVKSTRTGKEKLFTYSCSRCLNEDTTYDVYTTDDGLAIHVFND